METRVSAALQADPSGKTQATEKRLLNSCQQFASILVSYMMKSMRDASGDDHGLASGVYQDMFSDQVAKVIAKSNTLGIGDTLYSQLERSLKTRPSQPDAEHGAKIEVSSQFSLNKMGNSSE